MGPVLKCDWYSQWCIIVEILFFLCKWLSIVNSFLVTCELPCPCPVSVMGVCLAWICTGLRMLLCSLWMHLCFSPVMSGTYCSSRVIHNLWLLLCFFCFFLTNLWALKGGVWWDMLFRKEDWKPFSGSLQIVQLWVFVVTFIFSDGGLSKELIYGQNNLSVGVIVLLCFFSRTIVVIVGYS